MNKNPESITLDDVHGGLVFIGDLLQVVSYGFADRAIIDGRSSEPMSFYSNQLSHYASVLDAALEKYEDLMDRIEAVLSQEVPA